MDTEGFRIPERSLLAAALALLYSFALSACGITRSNVEPVIEFTRVPEASIGSPDRFATIAGRVTGADPTDRIVLYALSGSWWVQPAAERPFTAIQSDSSWHASIHLGSVYAALLVDSRYRPAMTMDILPDKGGSIRAVAKANGASATGQAPFLQFSGYQWEVRRDVDLEASSSGSYDARNAWIDKRGFLHLRISGAPGRWSNAGIRLSRSLGYGSYRFVVEDVSHLDPAAIFGIYTWDDSGPAREMDLQISRWGQPEDSLERRIASYRWSPHVAESCSGAFHRQRSRREYVVGHRFARTCAPQCERHSLPASKRRCIARGRDRRVRRSRRQPVDRRERRHRAIGRLRLCYLLNARRFADRRQQSRLRGFLRPVVVPSRSWRVVVGARGASRANRT
jgi:hypothetical protein